MVENLIILKTLRMVEIMGNLNNRTYLEMVVSIFTSLIGIEGKGAVVPG